LRKLFGASAASWAIERKQFVFRYRSFEHWLDLFRTYYGPIPQDVRGARRMRKQVQLADELRAMLNRWNRSGDATLAYPGEVPRGRDHEGCDRRAKQRVELWKRLGSLHRSGSNDSRRAELLFDERVDARDARSDAHLGRLALLDQQRANVCDQLGAVLDEMQQLVELDRRRAAVSLDPAHGQERSQTRHYVREESGSGRKGRGRGAGGGGRRHAPRYGLCYLLSHPALEIHTAPMVLHTQTPQLRAPLFVICE
jgi:Asp-tRNA(Asn)/Glu-tRNA(Gln) amidotransferase C subunit